MFRILYILLIASCIAISTNAQSKREYLGISFTVPAGWEVTEQNNSERSASLAITQTGTHNNTAVTMLFKNTEIDTKDWLTTSMERYTKIMAGMNGTMVWNTKHAATKTGTFDGLRSSFSGSDETTKTLGDLRTFHACGKTVLIIITEDAKDHDANSKTFDAILKSFTCK